MNTFESISKELRSLGLRTGDTIFLRISYKALGETEGGPKTFLDAILNVIGIEGTILLTAFPTVYKSQLRYFHRWDAVRADFRPKSNSGIMTNIAMSYPGSFMSYRLDFPFVVIGKHAEYLTQNHDYKKNGYWILEEAIKKYDCKCLRVGGEPFIGTTHMSLSHILREKGEYQLAPRYGLYVYESNGLTWRENNNVVFCPTALKNYLPEIIEKIRLSEGKIGNGYAIITDMKKSLALEEEILRKDIRRILCNDPNCCLCQTTFSFSDTSKTKYIIRQLRNLLKGNIKKNIMRIRESLRRYILFCRKND